MPFSNTPTNPTISGQNQSTGLGDRGNEMSKSDMIDFLNSDDTTNQPTGQPDKIELDNLDDDDDDDDKEDTKETGKERGKKTDNKEELDESDEGNKQTDDDSDKDTEKKLELSDEGEEDIDEDEEDELVVPVRRKEILKKYPNIFKEFPYLERAYYKTQKYTELFPTLKDAEASLEKASLLDKFSNQLNEGNTENLLQSIKQTDQGTFNKVVDNYLPTLMKVDQNAYYHVLGNVIKGTIFNMVNEARRSQNETLEQAAQIINQFVFGTSQFQPIQQLTPQNQNQQQNPELDKLKQERQSFIRERFETSRDELSSRVNNTLKSTINDHIDPKGVMPEYVKKNAVRDALEGLTETLDGDTQFRGLLDRLWEKAFTDNFSRASMDKIRLAYLSRARTILPDMIRKSRNEALKGIGKRVNEGTNNKGPIAVGRSAPQASSNRANKAPEIKEGMSTLDYLMQD